MTALTPEQISNIIDRYERGQSIAFISFATDIGRDRVRAELIKAGVRINKPGRPPHETGTMFPRRRVA